MNTAHYEVIISKIYEGGFFYPPEAHHCGVHTGSAATILKLVNRLVFTTTHVSAFTAS